MAISLDGVQVRFKKTGSSLSLLLLRLVSGMIFGLTLTLIFEEIFAYGNFAFWFVLVAHTGVFLRITRDWNFVGVLVLNLFLVLLGMMLRMYILIAPGA